MNPLLARVMGTGPAPLVEATGDVAPVLANLPRKTYRDRLAQMRQRRDPEGLDDGGDVRRVVGEAVDQPKETKPIIPPDAPEIDTVGEPIKKGMRPVRDVVMEPNDPYADKEKMMTPTAALVAPDVTPEADKPIDPSAVPGASRQTFRAKDAEAEPAAETQPHSSVDTMDILLGRQRGAPSRQQEPDQVVTAESAYSQLGIQSPAAMNVTESSAGMGQVLLKEGQDMPEHVPGDGRKIMENFRRFVR